MTRDWHYASKPVEVRGAVYMEEKCRHRDNFHKDRRISFFVFSSIDIKLGFVLY